MDGRVSITSLILDPSSRLQSLSGLLSTLCPFVSRFPHLPRPSASACREDGGWVGYVVVGQRSIMTSYIPPILNLGVKKGPTHGSTPSSSTYPSPGIPTREFPLDTPVVPSDHSPVDRRSYSPSTLSRPCSPSFVSCMIPTPHGFPVSPAPYRSPHRSWDNTIECRD